MKRMLALLVALMAISMSGALALTATPPDWLEEMQPGATYTYGEYGTLRAVTEDDAFTPQTLNSKLTFASGDVSADIDQTVATSVAGTPEGVTRQLMQQSASAFVAQWPTIAVDAENDDGTTTLIMNMQKDQSALFSGKIVSENGDPTLHSATDSPFDGLGADDQVDPNHYDYQASDDPYGGNHINNWYEFTTTPASFTATFDDTGSLTTTDANGESVTLKQKLEGAQVVVSATAASPYQDNGGLMQLSAPCVGQGEIWHIAPDGTLTLYADNPGHPSDPSLWPVLPVPAADTSSAQLTEAAASVTSGVTLTDKEIDILGSVYDVRTMDGDFGLDGAFANAVLTQGSTINVDLDGDMDFWWE